MLILGPLYQRGFSEIRSGLDRRSPGVFFVPPGAFGAPVFRFVQPVPSRSPVFSIGRIYNRTKKQGKRTDLTSGQNDPKSTAEKIATDHGISEKTVKRYGKSLSRSLVAAVSSFGWGFVLPMLAVSMVRPSRPVRGCGDSKLFIVGRYLDTVGAETPTCFDMASSDFSGCSASAISTARLLSWLVRLNPCDWLAPPDPLFPYNENQHF